MYQSACTYTCSSKLISSYLFPSALSLFFIKVSLNKRGKGERERGEGEREGERERGRERERGGEGERVSESEYSTMLIIVNLSTFLFQL